VVGLLLFAIAVLAVLPMFSATAASVVFVAAVCPGIGLLVGAVEHRRDWWATGVLTLLLIAQVFIDTAFPLVETGNEQQAAANARGGTLALVTFLGAVSAAKFASRVLSARSGSPPQDPAA
jgi:uncharacterized membrane protein HdeD (DUF308 family)